MKNSSFSWILESASFLMTRRKYQTIKHTKKYFDLTAGYEKSTLRQNTYFLFEHTLKRSNTSTAMMIVPADQMTLRRSRRKRRRKCPGQPVTDLIFDLDATESAWVEDALDSGTPTSMPVINSQPEAMNFQTKVRIHQYNLGEVFYHFIREAFYFYKKFLVDIF